MIHSRLTRWLAEVFVTAASVPSSQLMERALAACCQAMWGRYGKGARKTSRRSSPGSQRFQCSACGINLCFNFPAGLTSTFADVHAFIECTNRIQQGFDQLLDLLLVGFRQQFLCGEFLHRLERVANFMNGLIGSIRLTIRKSGLHGPAVFFRFIERIGPRCGVMRFVCILEFVIMVMVFRGCWMSLIG
jgi:hypothetical protein